MSAGGQGLLQVARSGSGDTRVLLLHELAGSHRSFRWAEPILTDWCEVYAVDLLGTGDSPPVPTDASLDDFADAVASTVEHLGIAPVLIAGVAVGGAIAASVAARYPHLVSGLVVACMGHEIGADNVEYIRRRVPIVEAGGMAAAEELSLAKSYPAELRATRPEVFEDYRADFLRADPVGYNAQGLALSNAGAAMGEALARVQVPTILVAGALDPLFPPESMERTASSVEALLDLRMLPEAAHLPHVQDPEGFADAIRDVAVAARQAPSREQT